MGGVLGEGGEDGEGFQADHHAGVGVEAGVQGVGEEHEVELAALGGGGDAAEEGEVFGAPFGAGHAPAGDVAARAEEDHAEVDHMASSSARVVMRSWGARVAMRASASSWVLRSLAAQASAMTRICAPSSTAASAVMRTQHSVETPVS